MEDRAEPVRAPSPSPPIEAFSGDPDRVADAVRRALADDSQKLSLPRELDGAGLGPERAIGLVTPYLRAGARDLGHPGFLAHMDPPTPWVSWVAALLGASSNQNLLHPDTAPAARGLEATVVGWLAPRFGMGGGHLVPGSTIANLTALWAARDLCGVKTVVASSTSHLSIRKAAAILGLRYLPVEPTDPVRPGALSTADIEAVLATSSVDHNEHRGDADHNEHSDHAEHSGDDRAGDGDTEPDPASTAVVLTAGTTGVGAIDRLDLSGVTAEPAWVHVDAAWAGPLQLSDRHRHRLHGIQEADSIALSAHKWLFQPKESALVLFKDVAPANRAISVDGAYLQVPNIGLLGSHGTTAAPLAATLLMLGWDGIGGLIDHGMSVADRLIARIEAEPLLEAYGPNRSGVVAWRHRRHPADRIRVELAGAFVSSVDIDGTEWLRSVAANPLADPDLVVDEVLAAGRRLDQTVRPRSPGWPTGS